MSSKSLNIIRASILFCFLLFLISFIIISYLCPDYDCSLSHWSYIPSRYGHRGKPSYPSISRFEISPSDYVPSVLSPSGAKKSFAINNFMSFDQIMADSDFVFNIKGNHVIVFLHIQKTGKSYIHLKLAILM